MLKPTITAIILAGGKSRRMAGHDKGLLLLKNSPLYSHVIDRIATQVDYFIISSNRHIDQYQQSGYPVFCDSLSGFLGPLAGIYTGLTYSQSDWNLIVSCDTPFLPDDLVARLWCEVNGHDAAYVFDGEKDHPTILLIHRHVAESIKNYLANGDRKLLFFLNQLNSVKVDFHDKKASFININTVEELDYWNLQ